MTAPQTFDLSGRVALVTGATRGIGRASALALAAQGARVLVVSRKAPAVEETVAEIRAAGGAADALPANVGRLEEAHALVDRALDLTGGVDILVSNAAVNPVFGGVEEATTEVFAKIMDVNVRAPFEIAKRLFASMQQRGRGAIVTIASIGGLTPEHGLGLYSMSKAALISLTKVFASEWGAHGIRANTICPGYIQTDFSRVVWSNEAALRDVLSHQPISRLGTPEDVANLVLFLASDAAAFCTGGVYLVDGGLTVRR